MANRIMPQLGRGRAHPSAEVVWNFSRRYNVRILFPSTVLVVLAFSSRVEVVGKVTCPTPEQVTAELARILPERAEVHDRAELTQRRRAIRLVLHTAQAGDLVHDIAVLGGCSTLAAAIAVTIAADETELHGEALGPVGLHAPPPPQKTVAPPVAPIEPVVAARQSEHWLGDVGISALGTLSDNAKIAAGGRLDAELLSARFRVGGRFAFTAANERSVPLENGHFEWTRLGFAIGPLYRFGIRKVAVLDLHLEPSLAVILLRGVGFTVTNHYIGFDAGLSGGLRMAFPLRHIAPFFALDLAGWLTEQRAMLSNSDYAVVPRFEALLCIGLSVGKFL